MSENNHETIKGDYISYTDPIQYDGAFYYTHSAYDKTPKFAGIDISKKINSETNNSIDITNKNSTSDMFNKEEQLILWEKYWLEYIDAFEKLADLSPESIVTIYIARQALEIGFKYLLLKESFEFKWTHNLYKLSKQFFEKYNISDDYMDYIQEFCREYSIHIEGDKVEYFRYPEYAENMYFNGFDLNISWLSYNFSLILLKLLHFSGLDKNKVLRTRSKDK